MSSSSQGASAPAALAYHLPTPYAVDSYQVIGSNEQSGSNQGGGGTGGSAPGTGSQTPSGAASALQFTATCQASDAIGAVVRSNGSATAVTTVTNAQAFPAVGVIIAKSSATACTVQTYGLCIGAISGLTPNTRYFVGADGKPTTSANAFATGGYIQVIGFAVAANALFVQPRGDLMQLAATRDANGNDTTPQPTNPQLLYGGVLEGTDVPSDDYGSKGDVYFRFVDGDVQLYGPKSDDGWGAAQSLRGADGNRIYVRNTDPDGSVMPNVGDVWINRNSATLFDAA